jgi:hypothetical protein
MRRGLGGDGDALIRPHETALDTRKSLGRLERTEMRALVSASSPAGSSTFASLLIA